jgi:histidinol-phosphate aminotransferase
LSKSYSLAGLRVGFLFGSADVVRTLSKIKDSYNLDRLALVGAEAAVRDQQWMRSNVAKVRETRTRMTAALEALGLRVLPSSANFVFARCASAGLARRVHTALEARGILVRYFDRPGLDDGLRITVGTDAEVDEFLGALAIVLRA